METPWKVGNLAVSAAREAAEVESDPGGYRVTDSSDLDLTISEREVEEGRRMFQSGGTGGWLQMGALRDGRRTLTVVRRGAVSSCDLRQARVRLDTPGLDSTLFPATLEDLDTGCGVDVEETLTSIEGVRIGSRKDLIQDRSSARSTWCATFPHDSVAPVIVFALTRILPLVNMHWAADSNRAMAEYEPPRGRRPGRRVYVIALEPGIEPTKLYVGQTGVPIEERFRQHKVGYRASRHVRRHGIRLMPEFYEHLPLLATNTEALDTEARTAEDLRHRGCSVHSN